DQITSTNGLFLTGGSIADAGGHAVRVLSEVDQLGIEADVGTEALRVRPQDRLEPILVAGGRRGRADVAGVRPRDALPGDLRAAAGGDAVHRLDPRHVVFLERHASRLELRDFRVDVRNRPECRAGLRRARAG